MPFRALPSTFIGAIKDTFLDQLEHKKELSRHFAFRSWIFAFALATCAGENDCALMLLHSTHRSRPMKNIESTAGAPPPPIRPRLPEASTSTLHLPAHVPSRLPTEDSASISTLTPESVPFGDDAPKSQSSLAPVDGGIAAWSLLAAAYMIEVLVCGFPNAFGVLLAAYLDDPVYNSQPGASSTLPLVGTLCSGIMYCSAMLIYPTMHYYPSIRRVYTWLGTWLCVLSLVAASFTTQVKLLVVFQGIFFGIGESLLYAPIVSYMSEWFVHRRGLANGIVFMGSNTGGVLLPLIFPHLISKYGKVTTIRIYAVVIAVGIFPVLPFMKARLPETRVHRPARRTMPAWLRNRHFWFFISINMIQGFGHFVPIIWLPTFAATSGLSASQSSLPLTLANAFAVLSGFMMGYLSDRYNIWALALCSLVCTSLVTFIFWGVLSYSLGGIIAYGIAYGSTAGGWSSMWYGFIKPVAKDDPSMATTIFAFLMLGRGIGNILSTPISTALQHTHISASQHRQKLGLVVANGQYRDMIIYVGSCFAGASVLAMIGWGWDRFRR